MKGNIHWVCGEARATPARCASTTACSRVPHPGAGDRDFLDDLNPDSKNVITRAISSRR